MDTLSVIVTSFSYKRARPAPANDHGGGYLFDCRCVTNPGRQEEYKPLTGLDEPVRQYLDDLPEMHTFLESAFSLVDQSVARYLERGFDSLEVGFGCTGGQHRSVYSTERCAAWLRSKYPQISVTVVHQGLSELGLLSNV